MEFLVEFEINVPDGAPESEVRDRDNAEALMALEALDQSGTWEDYWDAQLSLAA